MSSISGWMLGLLALISCYEYAFGHGRLLEPPSRSSMWRKGFKTPKNYNDNELFCGGLSRQQSNGMKCGVCGDPYDVKAPRANEMGGKYYTGIISNHYSPGQDITAVVELTANHRGFFEFRICPVNGAAPAETEDCMTRHPIEVIGEGRRPNESPFKYFVPRTTTGKYFINLKLPKDMTCSQCVFQWTYTAGNNWGTCENGTQAVGCGNQETFRGCADISIESKSPNSSDSAPASPRPATEAYPVHTTSNPSDNRRFSVPSFDPYASHTTRRPVFAPSPSMPWDHWNTNNAWPNNLNPGYPFGTSDHKTRWFYHQWPAVTSTARPYTPDLKVSKKPSWIYNHHFDEQNPGASINNAFTSRRPFVYVTPARLTTRRMQHEQEDFPSTPDLKAVTLVTNGNPYRRRKWNPEIDDFFTEAASGAVSTSTTTTTRQPQIRRPLPPYIPPPPRKATLPPVVDVEVVQNEVFTPTTKKPVRATTSGCYAAGSYVNTPGMDQWCELNCNHTPSFCPPTHCKCLEA